jgi:hypothetical protein
MSQFSKRLWTGLVALGLAGCSTVSGGPPRMAQLMKSDKQLSTIRAAIKSDCLDLPGNGGTGRRNDLVLAYMLAVDEAYNDFESGLVNDARTGNFVATIASLGLATAGGVAGGHTAKILSAANTGVIGEREAFNKEFLFNQTIPALQNQMRASRAAVRTKIYEQMARGPDTWPTCLALQDLAAYEQAGSLVGALVGITETTATSKVANEKDANAAAERLKFDSGNVATALRTYFSADDDNALMQARLARGRGVAMTAGGLSVPNDITADEYLGRILSGTKYAAQQRALALGIIATETDAAARAAIVAALSKQ